MSTTFRPAGVFSRVLGVAVVALLGLMTIIGSGGGGGGTETVAPQPIVYVGNTDAAVITTTNAATLVANVVGTSSESDVIVAPVAVIGTPQAAVEESSQSGLARRLDTLFLGTLSQVLKQSPALARPAAVIPVDEPVYCPDGGSGRITGTLNDDGTGTLTVTYNDCRTGEDTLSGTMTLRIDAFDLTYLTPTNATFTFPVLTLTTPNSSESVSGTLHDVMNIGTITETLTANMVTRDNLSGAMKKAENLVLVAVYDSLLSPTKYTETISGRVFDSVHGYVDATTPTPLVFSSIFELFPDGGQLLLAGAANASIRVTPLSAVLAKLELDLNGDTTYEIAATLKWTDLGGPVGADLGDSDGDGMHNSWETVNGLNPSDPTDAGQDKDGDGFTNLQEYLGGTDPNNPASVPPSADLAVTNTDNPDPVAVGGSLSYSIAVVNWGPATATDVVMTDVLPTDLTFASATTSLGSCTGSTTVTCNLGTLDPGWSATITLTVTASTAGVFDNTASVTSSTADGNPVNNSGTATTTIGTSAGSLQSLIDAASPGETILVPPGLYVGSLNFQGKDITLASSAGPASTILHGANGTAVQMGPGGTIRGFTITGASAYFGAGIAVSGTGSTISGNVFDGNNQYIGGYGAAIGGNAASPTIERNIFRNNTCGGDTQSLAGVVSFINGSSPTIVNNIFDNNPCRALNLSLPSGNAPLVINNTFVANSVAIHVSRLVSQTTQIYRNNILFQNGIGLELVDGTDADNPVWENNLVFGNNTDYLGTANQTGLNGNLSANPLFVDAATENYRLQTGSPAIDAGTSADAPSVDFDGTSRPLDGNVDGTAAVDIGAFEYSP